MAFSLGSYSTQISYPSGNYYNSTLSSAINFPSRWKCGSCGKYFDFEEDHKSCPSDLKRYLEDMLNGED